MEVKICVNETTCIRCGRCVKVCPALIFEQRKEKGAISVHNPENCIVCGHCVAVCPTTSICHGDFPADKVHAYDPSSLPTPEQVMLLCSARRSNRTFTQKPVPEQSLDLIVEAANRAPTATNAQQLAYTLVTDPATLHRVSEYTITVFDKVAGRLSNPFVKPWLRRMLPDVYRYLPQFKRMRREFDEGTDRILRGATALLVIHAPLKSRFGDVDANLAYQNASLMAESLGVAQVYMGFVLMALRQDKNETLPKMLGIEGRRICAVMALGMPQFRYPNYIDRKEPEVKRL